MLLPSIGIIASSGAGTAGLESIQTISVGAGNATTVTFSSIPSTYTHLQIRGLVLTNGATNPTYIFNGDTGTNYSGHHLWATGSALANNNQGPSASVVYFNYNPSTSYPSAFVMDILDANSTTKNKTVRILAGSDTNGGTREVALWSGVWLSTAAINSITLRGNGADFAQYSHFALYGIKVA